MKPTMLIAKNFSFNFKFHYAKVHFKVKNLILCFMSIISTSLYNNISSLTILFIKYNIDLKKKITQFTCALNIF